MEVGRHPASRAGRFCQAEVSPGMGSFRVLEYAAERAHRLQRRGEAAVVVALLSTHASTRTAVPIAPPALARRVRHDRVRPRVIPRVALPVPGVDVGAPEVVAAALDEQGGDQNSSGCADLRNATASGLIFAKPSGHAATQGAR